MTDPRVTGHLYVLQFTNGLIKVGRATNPDKRIRHHRAEGLRHSNPVLFEWVSILLDRGVEFAEEKLIAACRQPGVTWHGVEWFTGLAFEEAIRAAERIVNDRAANVRMEGGKLMLGRIRASPPVRQHRYLSRAPVAAASPPLPTAREAAARLLPVGPRFTEAERAELAMLDQALAENGWPPRPAGVY